MTARRKPAAAPEAVPILPQDLVLLLQQKASLLRVRVEPAETVGEAVGREATTVPQPSREDGYGDLYIEGWQAALSQLCQRLERLKEGA